MNINYSSDEDGKFWLYITTSFLSYDEQINIISYMCNIDTIDLENILLNKYNGMRLDSKNHFRNFSIYFANEVDIKNAIEFIQSLYLIEKLRK